MASLFHIVLVVLSATSAMAEAPFRFRGNSRGGGGRFFARQEVAPNAAVTPAAEVPAPYPAAGVTPSVPFELPNEQTTPQPENTYLPPAPAPTPDNTYGPPQDTYGPPAPPAQPDNQYGPPDAPPAQPDNQYGAPDASPAAPAAEQTLNVDPRSQRIISGQRKQKSSRLQLRQHSKLSSQPLRAAKIRLEPVEIIRSRPVIHYSVQYKSF